jgi:hypothetical protein
MSSQTISDLAGSGAQTMHFTTGETFPTQRFVVFPLAGVLAEWRSMGGASQSTGIIVRGCFTCPAPLDGVRVTALTEGVARVLPIELLQCTDHPSEQRGNIYRRLLSKYLDRVSLWAAEAQLPLTQRLALILARASRSGSALAVSHNCLSEILRVRRPGVTDALHRLEDLGLIRNSRMRINVVDAVGLSEYGLHGTTATPAALNRSEPRTNTAARQPMHQADRRAVASDSA